MGVKRSPFVAYPVYPDDAVAGRAPEPSHQQPPPPPPPQHARPRFGSGGGSEAWALAGGATQVPRGPPLTGPPTLAVTGRPYKPPQEEAAARELFQLPLGEVLLEDFSCATLKNGAILQGKLYLFSSYACFYSNVFGFIKRKIIPLKAVTSVRKAKTALVVPNAIEVTCFGRVTFFTSFVARDLAYDMMVAVWVSGSIG